jgi:hypothetical protein
MPTYTSEQQENMKAVRDLGRVVEVAVEHNSWGKSRSDMICRFPNTGGLHRTSGNAPFDTQNISYDNGTFFSYTKGPTKTYTSNINDHGIEQSTLSFGIQHRPRIHLGTTLINQIPHRQKGPE